MDQTQLRPSLGLGRMYAPGVRSGNGRTATRYSSKGGRDDRSRHRECKQHQHTQSGIIGQVQESVKTILDIHSRNNNWLGLAKRRKKKVRSKSLERPGRAGHRRKQGGTVGNCDHAREEPQSSCVIGTEAPGASQQMVSETYRRYSIGAVGREEARKQKARQQPQRAQ